MATITALAPDAFDVRDELLRLATTDPPGFCEVLHAAALDLKGAVYQHKPSPFAAAAREAGFALDEVRLRYGRIAEALQ